jgi:branched-chain amino acid transport system permease protein
MKAMTPDHWALLAAALVLLILPFTVSGYVLYLVNLLMVFVVLALGMHVVIGESGQFALAHAAFFGIGIYVAGIINTAWHPPFFLSIVAAGLLSAALGYLIGYLALRMRDIYLALATFAFGEAMQWVFLSWDRVTGGSNGMKMEPAELFGYRLTNDLQAYPFVILLGGLMLWLTVALARSQYGSSLRAVRESDVAAMAMGINVKAMKQSAFAISAAFAGIAGGMYTLFTSFIHPESLGFQTTILVLTMVVVGGMGSVRGAVAGAIAFGLISELLRQLMSVQEIIYGLILMGFMMYRPRGLFADRNRRVARPAEPKEARA